MSSDNLAVIPFSSSPIKDKYLVSNILGGWDLLSHKEFTTLCSLHYKNNTPLSRRLYERGLLLDEKNIQSLINDYRRLNAHLFLSTGLHIAVITTRCNLNCKYCQTKQLDQRDMSLEVAVEILRCISDAHNDYTTLEFQGGEPLLNWNTLKFIVKGLRKLNANRKKDKISLVTNATLLDEEKIQFLKDFDVEICISLDGPKEVHDAARVFSNRKGTYEIVVNKIALLREKFHIEPGFLATATRHSLKFYKEIIDEYVRLRIASITLRDINNLGNACINWSKIGYSADEFIHFYQKAMDYILALNKKGIFIRERMACVILEKILNRKDAGYVDLNNPCGAGRGQIVYMPDGSCYPCDESRMVKNDMFKLGNILKERYADLMKKENLLHLLEASVMNLWDYNSALLPWMGTCPILNYASQGNIIPKIRCSYIHKIYLFQFKYIFEKIAEDKENLEIFKNWIKKTEVENEA